MDEAKTLVHMSLSSMFSAMFIAAAVGLIAVGYMLWGSLSRQESANNRLANYANYTAFDNTTVRGQEVIQLIESNKDIFVVIYDCVPDSSKTNIDNQSIETTPLAKYVPDDVTVQSFTPSNISTENSNDTCKRALEKFKSAGSTTIANLYTESGNINLADASHSQLIGYFTTGRTTGSTSVTLGKPAVDVNTELNSYAAFKSVLIYADDGTTDIIGILLVRQSPYVEM